MGATPWNALVFLTLYAQTIGMSDAQASLLVSVFLGCTAIGGFLGGFIGDLAAAKYPDYGRIAVCQFSVFAGVPLSLILLKVNLPQLALCQYRKSICPCLQVLIVLLEILCRENLERELAVVAHSCLPELCLRLCPA